MVVLPAASKVNLQAAAQLFRTRKLEIAPLTALPEITGYERFATTAIGLDLQVVIDSSLFDNTYVYVASGTLGEELRITPQDLLSVTSGRIADLSK